MNLFIIGCLQTFLMCCIGTASVSLFPIMHYSIFQFLIFYFRMIDSPLEGLMYHILGESLPLFSLSDSSLSLGPLNDALLVCSIWTLLLTSPTLRSTMLTILSCGKVQEKGSKRKKKKLLTGAATVIGPEFIIWPFSVFTPIDIPLLLLNSDKVTAFFLLIDSS